MRAIAIFLTCAMTACAIAGRVEQITLDLERPARPFALTVTEATDVTVRANLLSAGAEFDPTGWTGLLWIGDRGGDGGGMTLTNGTAVHGRMTWELAAASTPTNGRYDAIVLGAQDGRIEEWGRGAAVVRLNPARTSLPAEWSYGDLSYVIATQALAAASAAATTQRVDELEALLAESYMQREESDACYMLRTGRVDVAGDWMVSVPGGSSLSLRSSPSLNLIDTSNSNLRRSVALDTMRLRFAISTISPPSGHMWTYSFAPGNPDTVIRREDMPEFTDPLATKVYVDNSILNMSAPMLIIDGVTYRQYWDTNLLTTAWEPGQ